MNEWTIIKLFKFEIEKSYKNANISLSFLSLQVTDMMVANSHNLIVTVKPANQRNNVVHRGSKVSAGNTSTGSGSSGPAPSHDSPSPASQSNPMTAR